MLISEQSSKELTVTTRGKKERKEEEVKRVKEKPKKPLKGEEEKDIVPGEMHKIVYGDSIIIYLKKGDRNTRERIAKTAKQFIDIYVEEEEP